MGRSYGKLTTAHREAIYDLKKAGKPGRAIREELKAGYIPKGGDETHQLDPVDLTISQCNRIGKRLMDERDDLFKSTVQSKAPPEALVALSKRLIIIAERETVRLEAAVKRGSLDARKLSSLATALQRLYGLVERSEAVPDPPEPPTQDPETPPSTFADQLLEGGEEQAVPETPPAGEPAAIGDRLVTPTGKVIGRTPTAAQAVPLDLPY